MPVVERVVGNLHSPRLKRGSLIVKRELQLNVYASPLGEILIMFFPSFTFNYFLFFAWMPDIVCHAIPCLHEEIIAQTAGLYSFVNNK